MLARAIIIDDEKDALVSCEKKLEIYCPKVKVIKTCLGAKEGLLAIKEHEVDIVFLDIEMPWMNGFELLECLEENYSFKVIFITAYDQYAIKAFKVEAVDYLLKPINKDELIACVNKVISSSEKFNSQKLEDVFTQIGRPRNGKRLLINNAQGIHVFSLEEIVYLEANSNYTYIVTTTSPKVLVSKNLAYLESKIENSNFFRTHKSFLVNLNYVISYSSEEGGRLFLKTGETIPVSRRRKDDVLNTIVNLE